MSNALYSEIIELTQEYLGPAAERFVTRQIRSHLNKAPQDIAREDIPILAEWSKVTLGLLTEDWQLVDEYTIKLNNLAA